MAKIKNTSKYPLKFPVNEKDYFIITDSETFETKTAEVATLIGQLFNLELLGNNCLEYDTAQVVDCETQEVINLPLQIVNVLLKFEETICDLRDRVTDLEECKEELEESLTFIEDNYCQLCYPIVNAGNNIFTDQTSITLTSTSSDPDGTITSKLWEKVIGGVANIATPTTDDTVVSGLQNGQYIFKITVVDNDGLQSFDLVAVNVNTGANQLPIVDAGVNQTIQLPTSQAVITAVASDPDGTIVSYQWQQIAGNAATIVSPTSASTQITGLTESISVFRVTVTDNSGAQASDIVQITVQGVGNIPPVANAGGDINISLPTNFTTLNGSGSTDSDGVIVGYQWQQISGGTANIITPNSASTQVTGLTEGSYTFRLTVTDNDGATDTDDVDVVISNTNEEVEIAQGDCSTTPSSWTTMYILDTNIQDGDIIYTNATLTSPYNGQNLKHRARIGGTIQSFDFDVSNFGVVYNVTACPLGEEIFIEEGDCANIPFPDNPFSVFVADPDIQNGDTIYTDATLITAYNGGGNMHVYKNQAEGLPFREFEVSSAGLVSNLSVCSTEVEIGLGGCSSTPSSWDTVYLEGSGQTGVSNGDIFYTDAALTTPYNGSGSTYRMRVGGTLILNEEFDVSTVGVVSNNSSCSTGAPTILYQSSNNCGACMTVRVDVPAGETREVTITKSGIGIYGGGIMCTDVGHQGADQIVASDLQETISSTKTYNFDIDAAQGGSNSATTSITLSITGGSSVSLVHQHDSPLINC